ncbi:MAG: hypothetical protein Q8O67_19470 [Deltaproteobacteria bacterium]|nr:hypothetical protein [Deltaproteobacteria bacterium]
MAIDGVKRPYVGQNAQSIGDVKQVDGKKPGDVTTPPAPAVNRAWAFELAADGSMIVPPPAPNAPGRDPLVIELGQIEVGTRIELISLSDNPKAEFDAAHKAEIFELPLTGYDVAGRTATISLNEEQMKEKNIVAGERFMIRQVDKDGNASQAVHVHLDPRGWANQAINEPVQGGGTQQVMGANIQINTGVTGLPGNANPGKIETVLGKATTDTSAPKLLESNVRVVSEKLSKADHEYLKTFVSSMNNFLGSTNYDHVTLKQQLDANASSWATSYKPQYDALQTLLKDTAAFERVAAFTNAMAGTTGAHIDFAQAAGLAARPEASYTAVKFEKALEPGVTATVQNSRTGEAKSLGQGAQARSMSIMLNDVKNGDPLIVTYTDAAGNAGSPYGFRFDDTSKDGKAKSNPLDIRLGSFNIKPKPATPAQTT